MPKGRVTFEKCVQDSQEYGSDDQHMVSRLYFSVDIDGKKSAAYVDNKQTVGSDFEADPFEVSAPVGYKGPFNHEIFRRHASACYRECVGSSAKGIRIGPNARSIRMQNNTFELSGNNTFEFDADASAGAW